MKKSLLILGLIAFTSLTAISCSTDDSGLINDKSATDAIAPIDNGDKDLPKPPIRF